MTSAPREMLEGFAKLGHVFPALIYGRKGEAGPLPKGVRRGKLRDCFANAGRLALRNHRFIYCEGFAVRGGDNKLPIPLEHAWVLDRETGRFVDVTWRDEGGAYFGIPFKTEFLAATICKRRIWGLSGVRLDDPAEFLFEETLKCSQSSTSCCAGSSTT